MPLNPVKSTHERNWLHFTEGYLVDEREAEEFDKQFSYKEKKKLQRTGGKNCNEVNEKGLV